tara:strand:- start:189 stop:605 length:417 start_codon:yes stop_codon:yes gene_type:complete
VKKIKKPFLIKYSTFPEFNGNLIPFYTNKSFPKKFKLKRFFILYGKKKYFRADHAHSKCSQIIIPLSGEILIKIVSKNYKKKFKLNIKSKAAIYVPPYNWITIYFKNNNDSLLTLCNYKYDKKEYISHFSKFKKIILK